MAGGFETRPYGGSVNYVDVFRTVDVATLAVIKSVLDGAGITYVVQGESALTLLPVGPLWGSFGSAGAAAIIQVPEEEAEDAFELLHEVAEPDGSEPDGS